MVPDGSDTVQICPDEAVAYYLQGFQMVPEMVQDGSDMVQMCSPGGCLHSICKATALTVQ